MGMAFPDQVAEKLADGMESPLVCLSSRSKAGRNQQEDWRGVSLQS